MGNKFDEKIAKMLNKDIYIPPQITNRIKTSLKEERKGVWFMKLNKIVATMAGMIIIGTGVVFATKAFIESRNTIDIAKDHGYFEKVDMDYVRNAGIGIKIENYYIDQDRAGITINIQSDEKIDSAEIYSTDITETNTYSETINGTTYIHWDESERGIEYSKRFNLIKFIDENGNEIQEEDENGRGPTFEKHEHLDNNVFKLLYTKPINVDTAASKMKVVIKRVVINEKEYIGDWEFEINIADKYFKKSNNIKYNGTTNLENVVVEKAELSATKLIVTLKTDDLRKLLYGAEGNKENLYGHPELYGSPELYGQEGRYNEEELNTEQSNSYDNNEIKIKFDISKFNSENSYKIVMPAVNESGTAIVITLNK